MMQVITTVTPDGRVVRNVDRVLEFGTRTSPRLYCGLHSLILWIAENVEGIRDLLAWMDDTYSADYVDTLLYYAPYDKSYPSKLTKFLLLLDRLRIPHEEPNNCSVPSSPLSASKLIPFILASAFRTLPRPC
jgi:hypothetical protein